MIKEVVIGLFSSVNPIFADRYYLRNHGPDVVRISGPWLRRYESYKTYDPPPEAVERCGAKRGRYTELWFSNAEEYRGRPPLIAASPPPWAGLANQREPDQALLTVPALPTEQFHVQLVDPEKTNILRWCCAIRYPDSVSVEEGEKWYLETHAQEAAKQPGLLGFYGFRALAESFPPPVAPSLGGSPDIRPEMERKPWVRVAEFWYEDFAAWRRAVIEAPPEYTPPPWGGSYPFVEMLSNFIDLKPDIDFLRGNYTIP